MAEEFTGVVRGECMYCPGTAELEEEDGLRKWVCASCGGEYGFTRLAQPEDGCSLGIPEDARRGISLAHLTKDPVFQAKLREDLEERGRVFLGQIGRRPE